ncbi:hypothetical protein [Ruegeria sp. HKCCD7319]|uniref:hypothetical protein n=1 Tax=Ruegeria sp. HKCCD7319 TaxID=2683015 RepID=UPI001490CE45|nr:hypothetical protein [Ruegeria sp. HKCCD7319]
MYYSCLLIAGFTIVLSLGSKQVNAQTVEDCAALADKEIRQECFEAAFKNKPAQEGLSDQEKVEQAWADIQSLSEILETSHQYKTLRADYVSICQLAIDSQSVNVFEAKRFDDRYTVDLSQLYSAEMHSLLRFNDTVLIVTERSHPIWLDQQVYTKDGSTFIQKNNAEMREVILTPGNDADIGELVEILQRSISRCKNFDQDTLNQGYQTNGKANSASSPLLGFFQLKDQVSELEAVNGVRYCTDTLFTLEIRPDGTTFDSEPVKDECSFSMNIPNGALLHETQSDCLATRDGNQEEYSSVMRYEWTDGGLITMNIGFAEQWRVDLSKLEWVRCNMNK